MRKRFDLELYRQNDEIAKKRAKEIMTAVGFEVQDNPKKRDVDLLIFKDGVHVFNVECEVKKVWSGAKFKYDNVQFPERKEKYALLDKPTVFLMFNSDLTNYLAVRSKDLLLSPKKEVPNKYLFKGELFFQVPLTSIFFDDMVNAVKEL